MQKEISGHQIQHRLLAAACRELQSFARSRSRGWAQASFWVKNLVNPSLFRNPFCGLRSTANGKIAGALAFYMLGVKRWLFRTDHTLTSSAFRG